jgi:hypothetical protein
MDESKNFLSLMRLQKEIAKKYGKISVEALRQRILDGSIKPDYVRTKKGKVTMYYFLVDKVDDIASSIFKPFIKKEEENVKSNTYVSSTSEYELEREAKRKIDEEIDRRYKQAQEKCRNSSGKTDWGHETFKIHELTERIWDDERQGKIDYKNLDVKKYVDDLMKKIENEITLKYYKQLMTWRKQKSEEAAARCKDSSGKIDYEKFCKELSKIEEEEKKLRAEGYFKP